MWFVVSAFLLPLCSALDQTEVLLNNAMSTLARSLPNDVVRDDCDAHTQSLMYVELICFPTELQFLTRKRKQQIEHTVYKKNKNEKKNQQLLCFSYLG